VGVVLAERPYSQIVANKLDAKATAQSYPYRLIGIGRNPLKIVITVRVCVGILDRELRHYWRIQQAQPSPSSVSMPI
jgi:hypothetical protein